MKVKSRRKELNLTQEDLSDLCGLHRTYISEVERGRRNPALVNIAKLAKALGMTASELLEGVK
ncbi:helix-turn-helix transcriptional regulator [bacterium]|nr:helix-turn-helix transcriptional regulator [bacterium]